MGRHRDGAVTAHHRTTEWARITKVMRPRIQATLPAPCVNRCQLGGVVHPDEKWDVAHIRDLGPGMYDDSPENLGPAHPRCNRSDGGKAGAQISNLTKKTDRRLLPW